MLISPPIQKILSVDNFTNILCDLGKITQEQWSEWQYRQIHFPSHAQTRSVRLFWSALSGLSTASQKENADLELHVSIRPVLDALEAHFNGKVLRVLVVNLVAGGVIPPHCDGGESLGAVHRCHLPLVTNENVIFKVGDASINMEAGSVYEISNLDFHSVENNSDQDRIHIIIDVLPNKFFDSQNGTEAVRISHRRNDEIPATR